MNFVPGKVARTAALSSRVRAADRAPDERARLRRGRPLILGIRPEHFDLAPTALPPKVGGGGADRSETMLAVRAGGHDLTAVLRTGCASGRRNGHPAPELCAFLRRRRPADACRTDLQGRQRARHAPHDHHHVRETPRMTVLDRRSLLAGAAAATGLAAGGDLLGFAKAWAQSAE